jgi:hypothetical protein
VLPPSYVLIAGGSNGTDYILQAEDFFPILAIEEIDNSFVEGPFIRKTH